MAQSFPEYPPDDAFGDVPESSDAVRDEIAAAIEQAVNEPDAPPPDVTYSAAPVDAAPSQPFEELTLADALGQFWRAPRFTLQLLWEVAAPGPSMRQLSAVPALSPAGQRGGINLRERLAGLDRWEVARLAFFAAAFIIGLWGCSILVSGGQFRIEQKQLYDGTPWLIAAFIAWLVGEVIGYLPGWIERFRHRQWRVPPADQEAAPADAIPPLTVSVLWEDARVWFGVIALCASAVFATVTWVDSYNNQFRPLGLASWIISITLMVVAFAPDTWRPDRVWQGLRGWLNGLRWTPTVAALLAIMAVGAYFRLTELDRTPPEMTSDHREKIEDAQRVLDGNYDIFFTDNGGREAFQMYAMALFAQLPGLGMNFDTLKLLSAVEGILTLPVLWWMGRAVIGERRLRPGDDPWRLANLVGLALAALVAVSYWHVALSRLALRIVLTPLVTALLLIFLARGLRHNRRGDFILAGLTLGFGLYTYQAVRMLPVVVLAGVGIAMLFQLFNRRALRQYMYHLAVLVLVSFVVFVPLFRFSVDFPELFWMRTAGRLLGDEVITETDENGFLRERNATISERVEAFQGNLPVLSSNMRNALLMYHWKGDVAWINAVPNAPTLDVFSGALLIVGLAAWLVLTLRARDPAYALIPVMVLIMLLPSALSIAMPIENPSATRTSGSLPPVYLLAALPLALLAMALQDLLGSRRNARLLASGLIAVVIGGSFSINAPKYLDDYYESYRQSWRPHSEVGRFLHGFVISDGAYGNAYLIGYPHWLDTIIVGMESGALDWANGVITLDDVPTILHSAYHCAETIYPLQPERDLLFFYNTQHEEAAVKLREWFPEGRMMFMDSEFDNGDYMTYRVPAPGLDRLNQLWQVAVTNPRCLRVQ